MVRKGKLVATSETTGLLPNNMIARAPDAARLNGSTHAQLRMFQLPAQGSDLGGGAALSGGGAVLLPNADNPLMVWTFIVPPDYKQGSPLFADLMFLEVSGGAVRPSSTRWARRGR